MSIPKYRCHKVVEAFKIAEISPEVPTPEFPIVATLQSDEGWLVFVDQEYIDKHKPEIGGYWVRYEDGYQSYSPDSAFESGYSLMDDEEETEISDCVATERTYSVLCGDGGGVAQEVKAASVALCEMWLRFYSAGGQLVAAFSSGRFVSFTAKE